ncbi:hypothetical protein HGRIS_004821 [Hohenbuehelia grisea]|uniref:Zn(2)-C6 fungal-type domain-containing protein n=1 Tax=Hohenbuehelia grisea TaxID=104357 RepID=A0ABR3JD27_9AGAR
MDFTSQHTTNDMPATIVHDGDQFVNKVKRKRLAKACDACHKSKRRCDGTMPCSNCFYASKQCTYTDSSGRPVPAPRVPDAAPPPPPSVQFQLDARYPAFPPHPQPTNHYPPEMKEDERLVQSKRYRQDRPGGEDAPLDQPQPVPSTTISMERPQPIDLDHGLTRELTNLFFTHCHPSRAIIHKPSFTTALSHNRVPAYLLHAVCALAAPLSKQPRIRTNPARNAGRRFALEALSLMFDGAGRLVVEPNLATAQALCLLQMHEVHVLEPGAASSSSAGTGAPGVWSSRYHDLVLQIIDTLGVHSPEHPTLTPVPSPEFIHAAIERECVRRIFWLVYVMDVMAGIYYKRGGDAWDRASRGNGAPGLGMSLTRSPGANKFGTTEMRLRLPADETSFELAVHSTLPEYLYLAAIRTQYASEFGHLIRVITIYAKIEHTLDLLNEPEPKSNLNTVLAEADAALQAWERTLAEQLLFSEDSLQVQLSMFETSSNMGAWCYCMMHVLHASAGLALNAARHRSQWAQRQDVGWAISRLEMIVNTLGSRARNSLLLGSVIWALVKYTKRDDPKIRSWAIDYEDFTVARIYELAQKEWRLVPSPLQKPLQYTPPSGSQQHPQHQHQQLQQTSQHPPGHQHLPPVHQQHPPPVHQQHPPPVHQQHPPPVHQQHPPHQQQHLPPPHQQHQPIHQHQIPQQQRPPPHGHHAGPLRRFSDVCGQGHMGMAGPSNTNQMPVSISRPPPHQHGGDVSYNLRGRSPSHSPNGAYPNTVGLGRSLDGLRLHGDPSNGVSIGAGPSTRGAIQGQVQEREAKGKERQKWESRERGGDRDWDREREERERVGTTVPVGDAKDRRMVIDMEGNIDPALQGGIQEQGPHQGQGHRRSEGPGGGGGGGSANGVLNGGGGSATDGAGGGQPQSLPSLKASGLLDWNAHREQKAATVASGPMGGMPVGLQWLANE